MKIDNEDMKNNQESQSEVIYRASFNIEKGFYTAERIKGDLADWTDDPVQQQINHQKAVERFKRGVQETKTKLAL